jgi:hypothetical protein
MRQGMTCLSPTGLLAARGLRLAAGSAVVAGRLLCSLENSALAARWRWRRRQRERGGWRGRRSVLGVAQVNKEFWDEKSDEKLDTRLIPIVTAPFSSLRTPPGLEWAGKLAGWLAAGGSILEETVRSSLSLSLSNAVSSPLRFISSIYPSIRLSSNGLAGNTLHQRRTINTLICVPSYPTTSISPQSRRLSTGDHARLVCTDPAARAGRALAQAQEADASGAHSSSANCSQRSVNRSHSDGPLVDMTRHLLTRLFSNLHAVVLRLVWPLGKLTL